MKLVVVPFDAPGCLGRVGSRPGDDLGLAPGRLVPDQPKSSLADTFKDARCRAFRVKARRHKYVRIDHDAFHAPSASAIPLRKLPPQNVRSRQRCYLVKQSSMTASLVEETVALSFTEVVPAIFVRVFDSNAAARQCLRRSISISATLGRSAAAHRFTASRMAFSARSGKAMRSGPGGRSA